MPTSRRSWARAALPGRPTAWPHTSMRPSCTVSSPAMQRNSVLLPEPLRPTMATVWPRATSKPTPSSTRKGPNSFTTFSMRTMASSAGMGPPFQRAGGDRQRIAQREIDGADRGEDDERFEGRVVDDLPGARQLDETDHRGKRGVLHDLHHEAHRGRNCEAHRLRQDHVGILLDAAEAEAVGGLPLRAGHGLDAAAPDLAQEGRGVERQRNAGGDQRDQLVAQDAQAEIRQEQHDQERRALDQLDVAAGYATQEPDLRQAHQSERQADDGATQKGDQRQQ